MSGHDESIGSGTLPPPRPPQQQRTAWWHTKVAWLPVWVWAAGVAVVAVVIGVAAGFADPERDEPAPSDGMTPVEAACSLLADGSTPDEAYRVMLDLLDGMDYTFPDVPAAARESVDRAVAQGC